MMPSSITIANARDLGAVDFDKGGGTVTVVTQDARTREVLMVAHADREALERTLVTGEMHYRSRSRGLWHKGATSGNIQRVVSLHADCDGDSILALVNAAGPACHRGTTSCFFTAAGQSALEELDAVIASRATDDDPQSSSYTRRLLDDRNLRLKKLGEECAEFVVACSDGDQARAVGEAADLYYHMMVALRGVGAGLNDLKDELRTRAVALSK